MCLPSTVSAISSLMRSSLEAHRCAWLRKAFWQRLYTVPHLKDLRRKLEANPLEPNYVLTVHGTGYKFTAEVSA